ncbi:hypothetical protein GJ654_10540 [Rhodoblastus acidophilus]|jgi:hypothetical protein|uniref:Uncharacterized protein n=1 Tax=Rhodoblastus acidophilus TaxID=1074 RepID=A0A6N8DLF8_RHOAC|nr:hypothetical protein [Rhodoblastus acidophilus]MCW2274984.1 hypothetical protein [Rhodoblastus acidophilus]MTV31432.1 hypothetical protein [Rhodoblastus acidophilus]
MNGTEAVMEKIINRLETIHRALRNAPIQGRGDMLVADSVALCLRDLHAIAAQASVGERARRPSLRLIDCESGPHKSFGLSLTSRDPVAETPS